MLALQPNRERVRGSFLQNVLVRAVPGGLAVTLACLCAMLWGGSLGLDQALISTVCTLAAGFSGILVLAITCMPLDVLRAALVLAMAAAMAAAVLALPQVFYLVPVTGQALWVLLGACGVAAATLLAGSWLLGKVQR